MHVNYVANTALLSL